MLYQGREIKRLNISPVDQQGSLKATRGDTTKSVFIVGS